MMMYGTAMASGKYLYGGVWRCAVCQMILSTTDADKLPVALYTTAGEQRWSECYHT